MRITLAVLMVCFVIGVALAEPKEKKHNKKAKKHGESKRLLEYFNKEQAAEDPVEGAGETAAKRHHPKKSDREQRMIAFVDAWDYGKDDEGAEPENHDKRTKGKKHSHLKKKKQVI